MPPALRAAVHGRPLPMHREPAQCAKRATNGPCTVTGQVLDYGGNAVPGAAVELSYPDGSGNRVYATETANGSGDFSSSGIPETTQGEIDVSFDDGNAYQSWNLTFAAAGPNAFTLQPGMVGAEIVRTSDRRWNQWSAFRVETYGSSGGGTTWVSGEAGSAFAMPPDCDYAIAYPWDNQGIEWSGHTLGVAAGTDNGGVMTFDQNAGVASWFLAPYWHSGKSGTRATVALEHWPADAQVGFYGASQAPNSPNYDYPFSVTSGGSLSGTVDLTIPRSAPPGYDYEVHAYSLDDHGKFDLTIYFQVASLRPSRARIAGGGSVKLSGIVPTEGHLGTQAGRAKYVDIYRRTKAAGQPTTWDPTRKGWRKVARVAANGYGTFISRALHPARTTWYVVRYPGDDWYSRAYTSVVKVVVK